MKPVAQDGELVLYADEQRERGQLHDTRRDTWSDRMPLQTFFKWGNFEPVEDQDKS